MKILKKIIVFGLVMLGNCIFGQRNDSIFVGTYKDGFGNLSITELNLCKDGTFKLKTPDPIFSYTYQSFENTGNWILKQDTIFLNPDKKQRNKTINFLEKQTETNDSITIKINYFVDYFNDDSFLAQNKFDFDVLTICINKKNRYYHLVREYKLKRRTVAHKVKNQIIVDATNVLKIPSEKITKIGVFTYGFDNIEWFNISNSNTNFIEIDIVQPVDENRMPRNRAVLIKKDKAYYYTRKGKIDKLSMPLVKSQ